MKYLPIGEKSSMDSSSIDNDETESFLEAQSPKAQPKSYNKKILFAFAASVGLNAILLLKDLVKGPEVDRNCISEYARLPRNIAQPFAVEGHVNSLDDADWDRYDPDLGTLALSDSVSASMGLPPAQRWPWDFSKGLYFLQGHHNMHCLYTVRDSLLEYKDGKLQSQHWLHVDHCLTALRDDILCNADDTPRFTGGNFEQPNSGTGQTRMCRDWAKLDEWAIARSGCYQTPEDPYDGLSELERYKHCPDGSQPWIGAEIWTMSEEEQAKGVYDAHSHGPKEKGGAFLHEAESAR